MASNMPCVTGSEYLTDRLVLPLMNSSMSRDALHWWISPAFEILIMLLQCLKYSEMIWLSVYIWVCWNNWSILVDRCFVNLESKYAVVFQYRFLQALLIAVCSCGAVICVVKAWWKMAIIRIRTTMLYTLLMSRRLSTASCSRQRLVGLCWWFLSRWRQTKLGVS